MIDLLRPSPYVVAYLFAHHYLIYPVLFVMCGVNIVLARTRMPRLTGLIALLLTLAGVLGVTGANTHPAFAELRIILAPLLSPLDGMVWIFVCAVIISVCGGMGQRWNHAGSILPILSALSMYALWTIAY